MRQHYKNNMNVNKKHFVTQLNYFYFKMPKIMMILRDRFYIHQMNKSKLTYLMMMIMLTNSMNINYGK